ncbi:polyribonucleotide nucleotidyltransferase 2, mitochondrial [Benincasa hispida]|uniref:polyribonucleotide nucleotidyltransferase 2, mitochondrial n=1 Tax=Benincasa hispida TaxID=102211 RepID=UPI001902324A|nr:polyribonucleotide nucleotidyltransferase 2, mitochondrial [Benincasa hispida]XP_038905197.1 polyribonucleotide nucleotidyltransferase 2, mitochondrial [Benincasa hispida]
MASMASKGNPLFSTIPHFLTWRSLGFRTICCGRMGFASQSQHQLDTDTTLARTKVLETFKEEFEIGSHLVTLETGKIARFANGAAVLGIEETKVLSTVTSAKGDAVRDFLPLTVDYQEKQFAQGVIPGTFMRREGAPKERELLCGRIIDRPIRPLFPTGFFHEVQVMANVLSSDGKRDPDVMAANATSAALMLSDIPWGGPIGVIRIGRINGKFIVNPTMDELNLSDLNLVYACTREKTLMIDVQAREITEKDLEAGLRLAHPEAVKFLEPQIRLAAKAGKLKKEYKLSMVSDSTMEKVTKLAESPIEAVFTDPSYGKFERGEALEKITQDVKKAFEEECDEEGLKILPKAVDYVRKKVIRRRIIAEGLRVDGRRLDEVRPLYCESSYLPILHGSSIFSRGDTQVLCTVTLGAPEDAQRLDSLVGPPTKRFMLHYSFPPFSINEVGKRGGLNRREVGHGTLAEKALLAVLPPEDEFPYTVRITSEVMASDGSTSMATVCGGSMALMDAGIPLNEHVAGVSVGLVSETDPSTGAIKDYRILTDILGLEDHLGDMDFKVAGTRKGITAIQLDIKPAGIPLDIICESLEHARKGRWQILEHMEREINAPHIKDPKNSPQLATLKYDNDAIRRLIGPLGTLKKRVEEETGARISVGDGTLTIMAKNHAVMEKVLEKVDFILGREIEIGGTYKCIVTSVKEYGAFVEFNGGQQGLLHISELSHDPISRVSDVVSVGQKISLRCIGQDVRGNIKLSLKATLPGPKAEGQNGNSVSSLESVPPVGEAYKTQHETQNSTSNTSLVDTSVGSEVNHTLSVHSMLIRSADDCDEEEKKSAGMNLKPKDTQKPKTKSTPKRTQKGVNNNKGSEVSPTLSVPSILIRSAEDCDEEEKKSKPKTTSTPKRIQKGVNNNEGSEVNPTLSVPSILIRSAEDCDEEEKKSAGLNLKLKDTRKLKASQSKPFTQKGVNNNKVEVESPITTRNLKIGMKVRAKIYQVRARGLVLDLGEGVRAMYRFEGDNRSNFKVGDELHVQCSSFSCNGIPVMSLVDNK